MTQVPAAVETPAASGRSVGGYALIGLLVGVVPSALGMLWLPSLRRADPRLLAGFMALTGGLLTFLAVDALSEALDLQAGLPGALGGPGLVLLGVAASYLALSWVAQRFSAAGGASGVRGQPLQGLALASIIAVGHRPAQPGRGPRHRSSFAVGELALGTFLIVGFMVHNVTEGLGIAAPVAEGRPVGVGRLAVLALVAGAPAIAGAWIGGFLSTTSWRCCSSPSPSAPPSRSWWRWAATSPGARPAGSPRAGSSAASWPAWWSCT